MQSTEKIIRFISYNPKKRLSTFRGLEFAKQVAIFRLLSEHVAKDIANKMDTEELVQILEKLDPDESSRIVRFFSPKKREKIMTLLNEQLQAAIDMLLSFEPGTAGQLMSLNYVFVAEDDTITDVSSKVRQHEKNTGKSPTVLVLRESELQGYLPGYVLGAAYPTDSVKDHVKMIPTLAYTSTQNQVIRFFKHNPHSKAVVLGKNNTVLGIIYSDDILQLLSQQESASLYDFAGLDKEESIYDPTIRKIRFRYKWLLLNLGTSFLAAFTVSLFEGVIAKEVLLAVFMPIVAGMGGNAGTQTLAVMVRGLAQHDLSWPEIYKTLLHEVGSGFVNGVLNGLVVFAILALFYGHMLVGVVLGFAMVTNLVIASIFGTLVPVLMSKLGKDPASSATIFITTATDVLGFLAFLGLATVLLK